jgi:hypothetical protein
MNNREEMSEGMTPKLPLWSYQVQSDSKLAVRTRKDLEIHLITRALKDEGFKREFLANPKGVVEKELGTKLPEELEINVLEETEDTLYMVLPCNPYEGMSEEELKAAVGMTYEDVAQWVLEQQRNAFLDEGSSVAIIAHAWKDEMFKQNLLDSPINTIEQELGDRIQSNFEIKVLVETSKTIYILISKIFDDFDSLFGKMQTMSALIMAGSPMGCTMNTSMSTDGTCCTYCCPCTELLTNDGSGF